MKYWFTDSKADMSALEGAPSLADKIKIVKDKMKVEAGAVDAEDVVSIPDVWNIHRTYEMMLLYTGDADDKVSRDYKEAVLRQWYAILAMHFLGEAKFGLTLGAENITEEKIAMMPEVSAELLRTKKILQAAWNARPPKRISQSPNFDPNAIHVYYVMNSQGQKLPYAMSSATTFLVPTSDAWGNLYSVCTKIPWISKKPKGAGFKIQDPAEVVGALTLVERETFRQRLNEIVYADLNETLTRGMGEATKLSELINNYANIPGHLLKSLVMEDVFSGGQIIDMHYVQFRGCKMAANEGDSNIGGMDDRCVCSRQEDDGTFTNYLISIPITNQAINWILEGRANYSVTLAYLAGQPQFTCQYTFEGRQYTKVFSGAAANLHEIDQANMGTTAIWPRYKMGDWSKYYVFHQPARGALINGGETYSVEPKAEAMEERVFPTDTTNVQYKLLNYWPQAWILWQSDSAANRLAVGYFLTREIKVIDKVEGQVYKAAIDFGTSSTMLYGGISREGTENIAEPIQGDRIWSLPIFAPKSGNGAAAIFRYFIPPTNSDTKFAPLQSILAIGRGTGTQVFTGNWTYFQQAAEGKSRQPLPDSFIIHSNLKWDPINTLYTTSFLLMVSYYVALEARVCGCSLLDAVISYPSAMTNWANYAHNLDNQLSIACEVASIAMATQPSVTITESCAVAQRTRRITTAATQFCTIDIGGGTSDIFLFKNDGDPRNLTWDGYESSLLCGARAILLENFVADKGCLNALIGLVPGDPVMLALQANVPQMSSWTRITDRETIQRNIESLLPVSFSDNAGHGHTAGEELRQRAVSNEGLANPSIARLRKRVAYYAAAVLFYAGLMTRDTGTKVDQLQLRFAGNGSKTLDWISSNPNHIKRFLSAMFNAGAGIEEEGKGQNPKNIQFANAPKHEVADGALKAPIAMRIHIDEILAGEAVALYDDEHSEPIAVWPVGKNIVAELFQGARHFTPGNDMLKTFVKAFRNAAISILQINLKADEFDPKVADADGVILDINEKVAAIVAGHNPDKKSFFMIGVEALSSEYFRIQRER